MLRHAVLPGLLLAASAAAIPAQAQMATYCAGAIQVVTFHRQIVPGSGLAIFEARLRNASPQRQTIQISATAPVQTHGSAPMLLEPGRIRVADVGNQRTQSGEDPLTVDRLARHIRITCQ